MDAIWTLIGLLVLAYMGTFLFGGQSIRGFGLASSAEYVVVGFVLGPEVLGVLERATLSGFDSVANVAIGWLALVIGLGYGFVNNKRVPLRSTMLGLFGAIVTGGVIFAGIFALLSFMPGRGTLDRVLVAGGIAAACAETTRHLLRWAVERHGASGPVSQLIGELADADDLVAIVATAVVFSLHPAGAAPFQLPAWSWLPLNLGLGLVMGFTAALLLGRDFRLDESWGVLLGTSLLTIGLSAQLGLSPLTTMFVMGVTIAGASRHRFDVMAMTEPTERAVLLPTLVIAGAKLSVKATPIIVAIIVATIAIRLVSKGLLGVALRPLLPEKTSRLIGVAMMSTGGLAMSVGLAFALRFPGPVGDTVLATVAAVTVFGEFIGPATLRAVLRSAGEIPTEIGALGVSPSETAAQVGVPAETAEVTE